ncbi:MAG: hypothetical protein WC811_19950 [Hyphomicrobium sp.]|jgi:hypothetical protein
MSFSHLDGSMPKANITLTNGTTIEIEGTLEEIQQLSDHLGRKNSVVPTARPMNSKDALVPSADDSEVPDIASIVSIVKDCEEAERIELVVLDRPDVLNRVLLCLWVVNRYVSPTMGLTSGDIEKITDQLGVRISTANASKMLSGKAKAFVSGDAVRKQGAAVHYRLNRRGLQAFESVLDG